jgi:hypothetical protein
MAKLTLTDITSTYQAVTAINDNNALIEAALENTLSRDGTVPNTMSASLDMNSNTILNLPTASTSTEPVRLDQLLAAQEASLLGMPANLVTIVDGGGFYVATSVEGALGELFVKLAGVATGEGASLIGVEDVAANFAAGDLEAVLAELSAAGAGAATEGQAGIAEIATQAETDTGTDDERFITPLKLANAGTALVTDSFTATLTGMTGSTTGTIHYMTEVLDATFTRVTMWHDTVDSPITGTSNSTAMTMTGLPAAITPLNTGARTTSIGLDDANNVLMQSSFSSTGVIDFTFPSGPWQSGGSFSSSFTNSGLKGLRDGWNMTVVMEVA